MREHFISGTFSMSLGKIAIVRYRYTIAFNISGAGLVAVILTLICRFLDAVLCHLHKLP